MQKERQYGLDYLRIISIFFVVLVHSSVPHMGAELTSSTYKSVILIEGIGRSSIAVFLMISGSLFLTREIPIKTLYTKYIFKMVTAFLFWSILYAAILGGSYKQIIGNTLKGHYHMWYIFLVIGLYMLQPILLKVVENKTILKYYIIIGAIFIFVAPEIRTLLGDFGGDIGLKLSEALDYILKQSDVFVIGKFSYYYILGYYIINLKHDKKYTFPVAAVGIISVVVTYLLCYAASIKGGSVSSYYSYFSANVMVESICLFYLLSKAVKCPKSRIVLSISDCSFGIYLIHVLFVDRLLPVLNLSSLNVHPFIWLSLSAVCVFLLSYVIILCIKKIPVINKYIV